MKAIFVFFVLCHSALAMDTKRPVILEAYGDSLTAAFLGGEKNLENPPSLKEVSSTLSDLAMFLITKEPKYKDPYEYRTTGWPARLAKKLEAKHGMLFEARNYGVISAETQHLMDQVKQLPAGTHKRTMAFVFIGHNDFAEHIEKSVDDLAEIHRRGLQNFFTEWDKRHWFSTMFIIPVGEVYKLYHALNNYVWFKNQTMTYKCNDSWDRFFPYARSYHQLFKQGTLDQFFLPRIEAFHRVERETARLWNWTSFTNSYYYYTPKKAFPYVPSNFAVDCFHLAANGQEEIAQETFDTIHDSRFDFEALRAGSEVTSGEELTIY